MSSKSSTSLVTSSSPATSVLNSDHRITPVSSNSIYCHLESKASLKCQFDGQLAGLTQAKAIEKCNDLIEAYKICRKKAQEDERNKYRNPTQAATNKPK